MKIKILPLHIITRMLFCLLVAGAATHSHALPLETYAANSVLSKGTWVKVSVPASGIYTISRATLQRWGFGNPANVRVYGYGARRATDVLSAQQFIDDLPLVQTTVTANGAVVFFANGPETWTSPITGRFSASRNFYTDKGYYFITEDAAAEPREIETVGTPEATNAATTFIERQQHEQELSIPGESGGFMVGEDFRYTPQRSFQFQMPGRVEGTNVWSECSFVAYTIGAPSTLTFTANGAAVESVGTDRIAATSNDAHYHGSETITRHTFSGISGNNINVGIRHSGTTTIHGAWLNYLAINYDRHLDLSNATDGRLCFASTARSFRLAGADTNTTVWDVTDPANIVAMAASAPDAGAIEWTNSYAGSRTYAIFNPAGRLPEPTFEERVANQDLHAMEPVNMVIITPSMWRSESERIAAVHRAEGLSVAVVDCDLIYNEFGSGAGDVHALRRFLKMLYDRGADADTPLQYALLMARATLDNRHNTAEMKNANPTLPGWLGGTMRQSLNDNDGYTTDDFIAMLADNSGTDKGFDNISIAVGRIPVTSPAEAKSYVDKLIDYIDKSKSGPWKNQVMMLVDDEDQGVHMSQAETMVREMQRIPGQQFMVNKVYLDAYEYIGGNHPLARSEMFRLLDEGTMWWTFIGHANDHSLTANGQLTYNDLNGLYLKRLPVLYAATCDFLRWDAAAQSGGELLFHERYGGIIAAISATRPVYIYDNGLFSGAIGRQMATRESDGRLGTIGDIYRRAKNDIRALLNDGSFGNRVSNSNRLRYVLMGDPAMRLTMPDNLVHLDDIDGKSTDDAELPEVAGMQTATFNGSITDVDGNILTGFNGTVTATIYDAEKSTTTFGRGEGIEFTFEQTGDKVFAGSAPVRDGRFSLRATIPGEIAENYRPATINMYAQAADSSVTGDAIGLSHSFYLYGYDETAAPDSVPPSIDSFYINHASFSNGARVNSSPMVLANVSDNHALNLSVSGVGRNMRLTLDGNRQYNDVPQYFTPASDGSPSGTIAYPLEDLSEGSHTLTLRIWDVYGNAAEETLSFTVDNTVAPKIYDIYSDANPATTQCNFYLSHDRPDQIVTVTVTVYNLLGAPLWSQSSTGVSDMFLSTPVTWDLCDSSGKRVPRGIYLYRATISDNGTDYSTTTHRIAVSN